MRRSKQPTVLDRIRSWRTRSGSGPSDRYVLATVEEAFAEPGCPLCRLLARKERRSLEALLWEQVNNPLTANRIAAARGFCWEHTWALVPAGAAVHSHLGVAIILERVLRQALGAWEAGTLSQWWTPQDRCPLCAWLTDAEATLLWGTAGLVRQDPAALTSRAGLLCRPHAFALAAFDEAVSLAGWQERVAREQGRWSRRECLSHEVGRRPWFLPRPATLPETCPLCLAETPRPNRLWAWLQEELDHQDRSSWEVPCLGHAASRDRVEAGQALATLVEDLAAFIRAADYRFQGELTLGQRTSWLRAIARLVGTVPAVGVHERQLPKTM